MNHKLKEAQDRHEPVEQLTAALNSAVNRSINDLRGHFVRPRCATQLLYLEKSIRAFNRALVLLY